jgi:hypothetical protein
MDRPEDFGEIDQPRSQKNVLIIGIFIFDVNMGDSVPQKADIAC